MLLCAGLESSCAPILAFETRAPLVIDVHSGRSRANIITELTYLIEAISLSSLSLASRATIGTRTTSLQPMVVDWTKKQSLQLPWTAAWIKWQGDESQCENARSTNYW
jgi:hypothetical protein